ncbi:Abi family protein, partial [Listeria monocytogenes]|nr:Abi family protein [Listeria monocytogenes]
MTEKVFKTVEEQIQILKSRNLNILDEKNAKRILQKISYYDIINGYNDIFLEIEADSTNGIEEVYYQDINFEMIYELYSFDADLRNLVLKYIDIVETYLSSSLAYVISSNHGHKETNYINKDIYKPGKRKSSTK